MARRPTYPTAFPAPSFRPDLTNVTSAYSNRVVNAYPAPGGFRPAPGLLEISGAVTSAKPLGLYATKDPDNIVQFFVGTGSTLEKYDTVTQTWDDVTGASVPNVSDGFFWSFQTWGDYVLAASSTIPIQAYQMGVDTTFADLANAPNCQYIAVVRDFLFAAGIENDPRLLKWSAINDIEGWTPGTNLSDEQYLPDGGPITGLVGGENCLVFQENSIRLVTFTGEENIIFQIDKISSDCGATIGSSIANFQNVVFFVHRSGIFSITTDGRWDRIGNEKVDSYFWNNVNTAYLYKVRGFVDPVNKLYHLAFPSAGAEEIDTALVYNWSIGEWALIEYDQEMAVVNTVYYQSAYNLDNIDSFGTEDQINLSENSPIWAGLPVQTVAGLTADDYTFGYFNSTPMLATIESGEFSLGNDLRTYINGARIHIDTADATLSVGVRDRVSDSSVFSSPASQEVDGFCNLRQVGRYLKYRVSVPAGSVWTFFTGLGDVANISPDGVR